MSRFIIQQSKKNSNKWVCTDTYNLIVCTFDDKRFYDTKEWTFLEDFDSDGNMKLAYYLQEMRDWLRINHPEKIL